MAFDLGLAAFDVVFSGVVSKWGCSVVVSPDSSSQSPNDFETSVAVAFSVDSSTYDDEPVAIAGLDGLLVAFYWTFVEDVFCLLGVFQQRETSSPIWDCRRGCTITVLIFLVVAPPMARL